MRAITEGSCRNKTPADRKWVVPFAAWGLLSVLLLIGCVPSTQMPRTALDTPQHHVANGNKLLAADKIQDATTEFDRALELDPKYAPALLGRGLVYATSFDYQNALDLLKKARRYATTDVQKNDVDIGFMRYHTLGGIATGKNWLSKTEGFYAKVTKQAPEKPAAHYYMGEAYKSAYRLPEAVEQYTRVLEIGRGFEDEADRAFTTIQNIQRAMPGSKVAKTIALLPVITRADVAALFIQEMQIDALYRGAVPKRYKAANKNERTRLVSDIEDHSLKNDIDTVVALGIKGLEPDPDGKFRPSSPINRAEFAMMIEDILATIIKDDTLATKFIGYQSPFPDLRNDLPYFNAVMVCTTRNIMDTKDPGTGEFAPIDPVSGAEALLSLRLLKNQLSKN